MIFRALILNDDRISVKVAPEALKVEAISNLFDKNRTIEGDLKGTKGLRGLKELSYMFHKIDPRSPYSRYSDEEFRKEKVKLLIFGDIEWDEDEVYLDAENKYKDLILSPSMATLQSAQIAVAKIRDYFEEVDFNAKDKNGRPIHDPKKIGDMIKNLAPMIDSLQRLQEKVRQEDELDPVIRGGVKLTKWNE